MAARKAVELDDSLGGAPTQVNGMLRSKAQSFSGIPFLGLAAEHIQ